MNSALILLFVILAILLANCITAADIGQPSFALGKPIPSTMRDVTVTVPVTHVAGREPVSCTVHLIGSDGREIACLTISDILEHDGAMRQTTQISRGDASRLVNVIADH